MSVVWEVKREEVDAEFAADIDALLGGDFDWVVISGLRSSAAQLVNWQKGRKQLPDGTWVIVDEAAVVTHSPPGHSAHEFGLAVDVARLDQHRKRHWDYAEHPAWPWLWAACKAHPRLSSGHDFPPVAPADDDHIQAVKWRAKKNQLRAAGQW